MKRKEEPPRPCRGNWTSEDLTMAVYLVVQRKYTIAEAASHFGMAKATIYRRINAGWAQLFQFKKSNKSEKGNSIKAEEPLLNKMEEEVLENTVLKLIQTGHQITSDIVKQICFEYCIENTTNVKHPHLEPNKRMATDDWYLDFIERHPRIMKKRRPYFLKSKIDDKPLDEGPGNKLRACRMARNELGRFVKKIDMITKPKRKYTRRNQLK